MLMIFFPLIQILFLGSFPSHIGIKMQKSPEKQPFEAKKATNGFEPMIRELQTYALALASPHNQ